MSLKWHRDVNGYQAESKVGEYSIDHEGPRKWILYVNGNDKYGTPGTLRQMKDIAETLDGDRKRRVGIIDGKYFNRD